MLILGLTLFYENIKNENIFSVIIAISLELLTFF